MNQGTTPEDASQLLQPFVDDELTDAERLEVSALLERSEDARAYVRVQSEVRELLRSVPRPTASPALEARVREALRSTDEAQRQGAVVSLGGWRRRVLGVATTMIPAAAAAGLLFMYASDDGTTGNLAASAADVTELARPVSSGTSATSDAVATAPAFRPAPRIRPANLHLPSGIELVSTQPVPLPASPTSRPLELVDARDGRRFTLHIRPVADGEPRGEAIDFAGRRFLRVVDAGSGLAVAFSHGDRIVTIATAAPGGASAGAEPRNEAALVERMLQMAAALEIR